MYDILVIGGGHAGCEAAHAGSKLNKKTLLITQDKNKLAMAPCNPSIGGPAKGVVVREIDALGGIMGKIADLSKIQIKMLNRSKGPAVHALRAQIDKNKYPKRMLEELEKLNNLEIKEGMVASLIIENKEATGVVLEDGTKIYAKKIIVTTGTYMDAYIINGKDKISSGPEQTKTIKTLSESFLSNELELIRLKTGTPARIYTDSIDFTGLEEVPGDEEKLAFSHFEPKYIENQELCWLIHTDKKVHDLIRNNLDKSAMYSGVIKGVGPRYCPSIEDKLVRFPEKEKHQLFLEPETIEKDTIYVQGFSTSMPYDIQEEMIRLLPGMKNAKIKQYGYAIEYDAIKPEQLKVSLETKKIKNLYTAGQINGTSGYEEAAGQGIVAGINAALSIDNKEPITLNRTNSYIGLMIDDLVTKGTEEPYRLLTSRSEYRLYLRHDNADLRLSEIGYNTGMLPEKYYNKVEKKKAMIEKLKTELKDCMITPKNFPKELAEKYNTQEVQHGIVAYDFIKRPNIITEEIQKIFNLNYDKDICQFVDIEIKYDGYIKKVNEQIKRNEKLYRVKIPVDINYNDVDSLALEAREKLNKFRPETIGIASQISGINPADITVLQIFLEKQRRKNEH